MKDSDSCILFIHGGGFNSFSPIEYQSLTYILCHYTDLTIYAPDYNTDKDYHYPNHVNNIYNFALNFLSKKYKNIVIIGDSSGGTITLNLITKDIIDKNYIFKSCVLYSPWIDLGCTSNSYDRNKWCSDTETGDIIFRGNAREDSLKSALANYISEKDLNNYKANPYIIPDSILKEFPPTLIFIGDEETLRDECIIFTEKIQRVNPNAFLYIFNSVWHDWIMYTQDCGNGYFEKAWQAYKITTNFLNGMMYSDGIYSQWLFNSELLYTQSRYIA